MAAKRISQSAINWASLAERVPPHQKPQYISFKSRSDGYLRRVLSLPEEAPKIDWAIYKAKVPVPGMVDQFKQAYEALKIPYPADPVKSQLDALEQEIKVDIDKHKVESDGRIKEYEQKLAYIASLIPYGEMTMEDFRDAHPDIAIDPINRPTFWPHDEEEQLDYVDPNAAAHAKEH